MFQENLPRSFGIELADLSRDRWSVIPKFGDLVAEMDTDRAHLTYMKSVNDAEDIRFFDRTRSRTIAIYPSKEKLATRGPFFNEDDQIDFDIVNYDIDASFDPRREWIDGKATLLVTARRDPISSLVLTLAEPLTVRSVTSTRHGYLMALRVSGQDDIIINLPEPLRPDELLDLEFVYGGRLPAIPPEREAIDVGGRVTNRRTISSTFRRFRATSTRGDRAGTRRAMSPTTRPRRCACACPKGIRRLRADRSTRDIPKTLPPEGRTVVDGVSLQRHAARALSGWATSRFVHVDSASFSIAAAEEDDAPLTGASYTFGEITVESSGMLQRTGPRAVRRDAARDEVLRVARLATFRTRASRWRSSSAISRAATVRRTSPRSVIRRRRRPFRGAPIRRTSTGSRSSFWRTRPRINGGGRRSVGRTTTSSGSARGSRSTSRRCTPST